MSNLQPIDNQSLSRSPEFIKQLQDAIAVQVKSKPYTAYITRKTPSAFVFLIDQSGSMADKVKTPSGEWIAKAEWLTLAVNKILNDILDRCTKGTEIRDYFELAVIGYGGESAEKANFAWEGALAAKQWVGISELAQNYVSISEDTTVQNIRGKEVSVTKKRRLWVRSQAKYRTPMNHALTMATELLEEWIVRHQGLDVYPPTVINITDGQLTDATFGEVLKTARRIKELHTHDGHVLFFNLHVASSAQESILFPSRKEELPTEDSFAHLLFDMSSDMPALYHNEISRMSNSDLSSSYTGMAYNASIDKIIQMMNIGTSTTMRQIQQP